jgi:hypothetical protein
VVCQDILHANSLVAAHVPLYYSESTGILIIIFAPRAREFGPLFQAERPEFSGREVRSLNLYATPVRTYAREAAAAVVSKVRTPI